MATLKNTLYPPLPSTTFVPSFLASSEFAQVTFLLSDYNSKDDIKKIHLVVVDNNTNENMLTEATGIKVINVSDKDVVTYDDVTRAYTVKINKKWMEGASFIPDMYYKIQIRFDSAEDKEVSKDTDSVSRKVEEVSGETESKKKENYLIDNQSMFSEWSSVTFIRFLDQAKILLSGFDEDGRSESSYNKGIIPVYGKVDFGESKKAETLQSFFLSVLDESGLELLKTPAQYTAGNFNKDEIAYNLDIQGLNMVSGGNLVLRVSITTNNLYTTSRDFTFSVFEFFEDDTFSPSIFTEVDNGDALTYIRITNPSNVNGTLYVKRASSSDNYTVWEDFFIQDISGPLNILLADDTVASMSWYQYSVQLKKVKGAFTPVYRSEKVFNDFFDANFVRDGRQIPLRYNFQISSIKPVVNRVKVDTLGGKYPLFLENAHMNYRQMSISGLISAQMDETGRFLDKKEHFSRDYGNYILYNDEEGIDDNHTYDYFWEREFREEAVKWLNDGEPKLFRSMTEGNIVVILSDVNLTPNTTLSRRLYSFTATAYEVADGTSIKNLEALGITPVKVDGDSLDDDVFRTPVKKIGQLYSATTASDGNVDIVTSIVSSVEDNHRGIGAGTKIETGSVFLSDVKIQFSSMPTHVQTTDGRIVEVGSEPGAYGYLIAINGVENILFIDADGFRQIPSDVEISSFYVFGSGVEFTVDFTISYNEIPNESELPKSITLEKKVVGQEWGPFLPKESLSERLAKRYSYLETDKDNNYVESIQLSSWQNVIFDTSPFTVVDLLFDGNDSYKQYCVGTNGVLAFKDFRCADAMFRGVLMRRITDDVSIPRYNECFVYDSTSYIDEISINNPVDKTVYYMTDGKCIFYSNGVWYPATKTSFAVSGSNKVDEYLVEMPVGGYISFLADLVNIKY